MNSDKILNIAGRPDSMEKSDISWIEPLVKDYPYYQMAHVLLLMYLKKFNPEEFDIQLRNSAIHITDRKNLYNLLYQFPVEKEPAHKTNVINDNTSIEPVEFQFEETKSDLTIEVPFSALESKDLKEEEKVELLEIDEKSASAALLFDSDSLNNELNDSDGNTFSLIDKFIEENPAFVPNKLDLNEKREDISVNSIQEDDSLVTETLAQIFEMQKLYEKAIIVYEKLILKYPEKSTYFASRINELKTNIK